MAEKTAKAKRTLKRILASPAAKEAQRALFCFIALFAVSRGRLPDGLMPFAPAAAAAAWIAGVPPFALIGCVLGAAGRMAWDVALSVTVTLGCAWVLRRYTGRILSRQASLAVVVGEVFALVLFRSTSPYNGMMGCLSAVAAVLLTQVYASAFKVASSIKTRKLLTEEEVISLAVAAGSVLLGTLDFAVLGLSLSAVAGGTIVLVLAYTGGAGAGAGAGVTLGVMLALGGSGQYITQLGVAGVVAGGMKRLGRGGAALGCLFASAAVAVYSRADFVPVFAGALAGACFMLMPDNAIETVGRFVNASLRRERNRKEYLTRLREMTRARLAEFSGAFSEMGAIFEKPVQREQSASTDWDFASLKAICEGCPAQNRCWSDEKRLRTELEQVIRGWETPWRLQRCTRLSALAKVSKALMQSRDRERAETVRASNCTMLAGRQLKGIASVIDSLSERISKDVRYDDKLEAELMRELAANGVTADDAVAQLSGDRLTVTLTCKRCMSACNGRMRTVVSETARRSMRLAGKHCDGECRVMYEESRAFEVHAGVSRLAKDGVCGDSALVQGLPDGRYLIALSDGMGSGGRAARESRDAVALLSRLYRAGVDTAATLSAVNRLLLLRSTTEMYTTLDCCLIDLVNGKASCAKQSAAPTVWIHGGRASMLSGESLPSGILEEAPPSTHTLNLAEGDWLFFVSDGVYDALGDSLPSVALNFACGDAQGAANCMLQAASEMGANDDMTVIAARMIGAKSSLDVTQ